MKDLNSLKRPSGSKKILGAALLIAFAVGGATLIISNEKSELSSSAPDKVTKKSTDDGAKVSAVIEIKKDSQKDLSSVSIKTDVTSNLVGNYILSKSNNAVCGHAGSMMQVQLLLKGEPVLTMAGGNIRFIDLNKGVITEPAYEGDKKAQSFERNTVMSDDKLTAEETMKSHDQPVLHSLSTLDLAGGVLVYSFHQDAFNPDFGNTFDISCEWTRR